MEKVEINIFIILAVILSLSLVIFIAYFVIIYRKKQQQHFLEQEILKSNFSKELSLSKLEIQEKTFGDISRELHDSACQLLVLIIMQLRTIGLKHPETNEEVEDSVANAKDVLEQIRNISHLLNTNFLEKLSLEELIHQESDRLNRSGFIKIAFKAINEPVSISGQQTLFLFRVIQECIQNTMKYASAKLITIELIYEIDQLILNISDNGCGFDMDKLFAGIGIKNMYHRIGLLKGTVNMNSAPGQGTTVKINVPYAL